jgi:hypothetical protein
MAGTASLRMDEDVADAGTGRHIASAAAALDASLNFHGVRE